MTGAPVLEVLAAGPSTTVQDGGRPGLAHVGVGSSGAADRGALRRANALVGNPPGAAGLEVLLGGLALRALAPVAVAVTGAPGPVDVDGRAVGTGAATRLRPGEVLRLAHADRGVRRYVAVAGGVQAPAVLGSRSRDGLAGLGPEPVVDGQLLAVAHDPNAEERTRDDRLSAGAPVVGGTTPRHGPHDDGAQDDGHRGPDAFDAYGPDGWVLPVLPGPQAGWFRPGALLAATLTVSPTSDRTAVRLDGPPVERRPAAVGRELAPAGLVRGAVQVPPDGRPVVFGADHPVTGGYPVVAVVRAWALDAVGQLRPGDPVRFVVGLHPGR